MVALLDVNVLVALAWPNHVHHMAAHTWFAEHGRDGWATCSLVELGFIRASSNARVTPSAVSPQEAARLLRRMTALAEHHFWADDIRFAESPHVGLDRVAGHQLVTTAHLVALAVRRRQGLATFDPGVRTLVPAGHDPDALVVVIPAEA
jgi:uncharacterized protein